MMYPLLAKFNSLNLFFAVHTTLSTASPNSLFCSVRNMDGDEGFQFTGRAALFSEESSRERDALIQKGDSHTLRSIMTTALIEVSERVVLRKPTFLFGDTAADPEGRLSVGE